MSRGVLTTRTAYVKCDGYRCTQGARSTAKSLGAVIQELREAGWDIPQRRGRPHLCPRCAVVWGKS